ncbi:unnamed protein product [Acanthocheilonema viteae]|uniref:Uncharacterized protein n=1 Tax=Acanthocheilonema viteae TaxID=6277 RepID=A0A498SP00_ACAVI|nr:unnamed protein product [Acanthocheilonema viteae]
MKRYADQISFHHPFIHSSFVFTAAATITTAVATAAITASISAAVVCVLVVAKIVAHLLSILHFGLHQSDPFQQYRPIVAVLFACPYLYEISDNICDPWLGSFPVPGTDPESVSQRLDRFIPRKSAIAVQLSVSVSGVKVCAIDDEVRHSNFQQLQILMEIC